MGNVKKGKKNHLSVHITKQVINTDIYSDFTHNLRINKT